MRRPRTRPEPGLPAAAPLRPVGIPSPVAADVEAFLARGGRIWKLANGEVSRPFKHLGKGRP